jgi:hypothetical protein
MRAPSVIPAARAKVQLEWPRGWNLLVGQKERFEAQVSFLLFFCFIFCFLLFLIHLNLNFESNLSAN